MTPPRHDAARRREQQRTNFKQRELIRAAILAAPPTETNAALAERLGISVSTVYNHRPTRFLKRRDKLATMIQRRLDTLVRDREARTVFIERQGLAR